jgi:DNA-binding response OmpR family regulator
MKNILVLEDDTAIAREVETNLENDGFLVTVMKAISQTKALDFKVFDLLIFDWNLPDGESIELVGDIRAAGITTPILMLTANTEIHFRDQALIAGVDDFLGKPFYFHELRARIEILLKSSLGKKSDLSVLESSGIKLDPAGMNVSYFGNSITTTKKEFDLIHFFLRNPNHVYSRNEILDAVWGEDDNPTPRTVDTHILNLRKKTKAELFQTVWSSGYRFVPDEES